MISASYKLTFSLPEFTHQRELKQIADKLFIPMMQQGIDRGVDLLGGPFPPNAESTVKAKGHNRVLIGKERKLRKSFQSRKEGKDAVVISLTPDRADIGGYLQNDGIRTKSGMNKYNFFGINKEMENQAMKYMEEVIKKKTQDANKR